MSLKRGLFITFEGTEGAGKSSLMRALSKLLKKNKIKHITTREPGGPPLSEKIRSLILKEKMTPVTEIFLYEAARSEHIAKTIKPALAKKMWVICDRFTDSTLAYQAHARGLPWKKVKMLNDYATQGLRPHLKVFIDIDPALGLKRAQEKNRFEKEGLHFQKKVKKGFLKSIRENKKKWVILKPKKDPPEVLAQKVFDAIKKKAKKDIFR